MNGAALDSILVGLHGKSAQLRSLTSGMSLIPTSAGLIRVYDSGGHAPPVIFTPDGPCVIEHYPDLIHELRKDFRVVCFDMPGSGFSYPSRGYRYSISEGAQMLLELMDKLQLKKTTLAFSCANGFFALGFAKRHPERITKLVLAQTPSLQAMRRWTERMVPKPLHIPFIGQTMMALTKRKFAASWFDLALPRGSSQKEYFVKHSLEAVQGGGCFCLASVVQGLNHAVDADVNDIQCPTLLIHGDSDFSHKHTDFDSIHDLVAQAKVVKFKGCGHLPDLERRAEYVEALKNFMLSPA